MTVQDAVKLGILEKLGFKLLPDQKQWLMQPPSPQITSIPSNIRMKMLKGTNPGMQVIIDDIKDWQAIETKLKDDTKEQTIMQKIRRCGFSMATMLDMGGAEIVMVLIPVDADNARSRMASSARTEVMNMVRAVPDPIDIPELPRREIQPRFKFNNVRKIRK